MIGQTPTHRQQLALALVRGKHAWDVAGLDVISRPAFRAQPDPRQIIPIGKIGRVSVSILAKRKGPEFEVSGPYPIAPSQWGLMKLGADDVYIRFINNSIMTSQ